MKSKIYIEFREEKINKDNDNDLSPCICKIHHFNCPRAKDRC